MTARAWRRNGLRISLAVGVCLWAAGSSHAQTAAPPLPAAPARTVAPPPSPFPAQSVAPGPALPAVASSAPARSLLLTAPFPSPSPVVPQAPSAVYLGIGLDDLDTAQYEAAGTDFDWGYGKGPGGGMLISFVDPDSNARAKGICWGDILVAVDWGKGGAQRIVAMQDFELCMAQIRPGAPVTLQVFNCGRVRPFLVPATAWSAKSARIWPDRGGRGPYYFPWLKDRPALVDYRVSECIRTYRTDKEPLALKELADTYFMTGRYSKAVESYETYFSAHPAAAMHYPALYAQAYAARMAGQWEKSRALAEQAVAVRPRSYLALYEWARALHQLGRDAGALNCMNNALQLLPAENAQLRQSFESWRDEIAAGVPPAAAPTTLQPGGQGAPVPQTQGSGGAPRAPGRSETVTGIPPALPSPVAASPVSIPSPTAAGLLSARVRDLSPSAPAEPQSAASRPSVQPLQPAANVALAAPNAGEGPLLVIDSVQSLLAATPGAHVLVVVDYQLGGLTSGASVAVVETVRLKKGQEVFQTWTRSAVRQTGRFELRVVLTIPANLTPGDYELEGAVSSGAVHAEQTATLTVRKAEE